VFWVCAILLTTALLSVGVTEGIKHFAARPRPRFVTENPSAFAAWWSFGTGRNARALYTAKGVLAEEFKSFPSGHAACAALLLMLPLLCRIDERLRGGEGVLFCAGSGVCFLICFSRVVSGAHYLSDVIFGVGVSFCVLWCVVALLDRMRAKRDARQAQPRRAERH
jgi:membrane-associated phospholipid phosphatase